MAKFDFLDHLNETEMKRLSYFINDCLKIKREIKENQKILSEQLKNFSNDHGYETSLIRKLVNLSFKIINEDENLIEKEMKILNLLSNIQNKKS
ncbi:MAG: hypothetical protein QXF12_01995 [Candidatus Aenigmatarchaeota archaeon]